MSQLGFGDGNGLGESGPPCVHSAECLGQSRRRCRREGQAIRNRQIGENVIIADRRKTAIALKVNHDSVFRSAGCRNKAQTVCGESSTLTILAGEASVNNLGQTNYKSNARETDCRRKLPVDWAASSEFRCWLPANIGDWSLVYGWPFFEPNRMVAITKRILC